MLKVVIVTMGTKRKARVLPFKTPASLDILITQLYEQGADSRRIGQYVRKWGLWFVLVWLLDHLDNTLPIHNAMASL